MTEEELKQYHNDFIDVFGEPNKEECPTGKLFIMHIKRIEQRGEASHGLTIGVP